MRAESACHPCILPVHRSRNRTSHHRTRLKTVRLLLELQIASRRSRELPTEDGESQLLRRVAEIKIDLSLVGFDHVSIHRVRIEAEREGARPIRTRRRTIREDEGDGGMVADTTEM